MAISRKQMVGMTTNERLFETRLMTKFERAVSERDEARAREILQSAFVDERSIDRIIGDYLA
jgi:hypothetical protein